MRHYSSTSTARRPSSVRPSDWVPRRSYGVLRYLRAIAHSGVWVEVSIRKIAHDLGYGSPGEVSAILAWLAGETTLAQRHHAHTATPPTRAYLARRKIGRGYAILLFARARPFAPPAPKSACAASAASVDTPSPPPAPETAPPPPAVPACNHDRSSRSDSAAECGQSFQMKDHVHVHSLLHQDAESRELDDPCIHDSTQETRNQEEEAALPHNGLVEQSPLYERLIATPAMSLALARKIASSPIGTLADFEHDLALAHTIESIRTPFWFTVARWRDGQRLAPQETRDGGRHPTPHLSERSHTPWSRRTDPRAERRRKAAAFGGLPKDWDAWLAKEIALARAEGYDIDAL